MNATSIGYEGRSLDDVISALRLKNVDLVVDVRLNAISRKRGFSKTALREGLESAGIGYVHLPSLGNARENRAGYSEVGTSNGERARDTFRERLSCAEARSALDHVEKLTLQRRIALFCFEHEESHCHREQLLEALRLRSARELASA